MFVSANESLSLFRMVKIIAVMSKVLITTGLCLKAANCPYGECLRCVEYHRGQLTKGLISRWGGG
jgi:hypothetical protein